MGRRARSAGLREGELVRASTLILCCALSGCTTASPPAGAGEAEGPLRVKLVEDYYWPSAVAGRGLGGTDTEIEVFPLVPALVVEHRDGRPLGADEEGASRAAAGRHCAALGLRFVPDATGRLADGAWAFAPCIAG